MANIEDLPIWVIPFLTSKYFDNDDKEGKNGTCVCGGSKHFRPYFCVQCEEGHLCKQMFQVGRTHFKHKKLQVHKVTERNSINIDEIPKLGNKDDNSNNNNALEYIVANVRDYKYNGNRAITLLGDKLSHKRRKMGRFNNEVDREICKWCGRSTRTLDREPKNLCSLGCALECKFDMTLQQIHNVQLCLNDKGDLHVPLNDIHMAVTLLQMKNVKDGEICPCVPTRKFQRLNEVVGMCTIDNTNSSSQTILSTTEKDANKPTHDGIIPLDNNSVENNQKMIPLVDLENSITRSEIAAIFLSFHGTQGRENASVTKEKE